jgi:integrase
LSLAKPAPRVFPDSNVLVEGLFSPWSVSRAILIMARAKLFSLVMKASKTSKKSKTKPGNERTALIQRQASDPALTNAVAFWTDATTSGSILRRRDIKRDKSNAVLSFFGSTDKHPAAVTASDVKRWQVEMEEKGLAQTTVYTRICHLSSFFRWAMKDSLLGQYLVSNPVSYAHPKAPKPYQTRSAKSLTEEQVFALLKVVGAKAALATSWASATTRCCCSTLRRACGATR